MDDKTLKTLGYVIRSIWFIAKIAIVCVVVTALMIVGYIMARDFANVYIITTDGMKLRAGVILGTEDSSDLYKFFSSTYVTNDSEITDSRYNGYLIRDFEYNLKIKSLWCNPWDKSAEVVIEESIPEIDGEKPAASEGGEPELPPEWQRRRFKLTFTNQEDRWLINDISVMEYMEPEPTPTDEPEISPTPEGMTPTPTATSEG
jgi:hypothetical protein